MNPRSENHALILELIEENKELLRMLATNSHTDRVSKPNSQPIGMTNS